MCLLRESGYLMVDSDIGTVQCAICGQSLLSNLLSENVSQSMIQLNLRHNVMDAVQKKLCLQTV